MSISDSLEYLPPLSGTYHYNTFKPGAAGFPAFGGTYVDPIFGETVRRMSDIGLTVDDCQQYGFPVGNADGTLIFHWTLAGTLDILNSSTGVAVYNNVPGGTTSPSTSRVEMRWSHVNPDVYFYPSGTNLRKRTLSAGTDIAYHNFSNTLQPLGGSVITQSRDDRYFLVRYGETGHVWDSQSNIVYTGNVPLFGGGGYMGLTPDGAYVVGASYGTRAGFGSRLKSFAIDHTNHIVDTTGVDYWNIGGAHATFISASNGNNYAIVEDSVDDTRLYAVDITTDRSTMSIANQKASGTLLLDLDPFTDQFHMCAVVNGTFQNWAFISTERTGLVDNFDTTPTGATWFPFNQEVLAVNPVTGAHLRLAHHRSRGDFGNNAVYQAQPRASGSVIGNLVVFSSNMNISSPNNYADMYLIPDPLGAAPIETILPLMGQILL